MRERRSTAASPDPPEPPESVGDVAHARLRTDILFGRLPPGERLRLDAASERYGVSVGTMRELLSRLSAEGLVLAEGGRGFQVAPVSAVEFREVGALRLLLETHAMESSFASGDLDWEARVVAAHHKLSVLERRMVSEPDADPVTWKDCDRAFHGELVSACGSRLLISTLSAVYDKYLRYQMIAVVFRGEAAAREHDELARCALARDAEGAGRILRVHIESCIDHALARGFGVGAVNGRAPETVPAGRPASPPGMRSRGRAEASRRRNGKSRPATS